MLILTVPTMPAATFALGWLTLGQTVFESEKPFLIMIQNGGVSSEAALPLQHLTLRCLLRGISQAMSNVADSS